MLTELAPSSIRVPSRGPAVTTRTFGAPRFGFGGRLGLGCLPVAVATAAPPVAPTAAVAPVAAPVPRLPATPVALSAGAGAGSATGRAACARARALRSARPGRCRRRANRSLRMTAATDRTSTHNSTRKPIWISFSESGLTWSAAVPEDQGHRADPDPRAVVQL